MTAATVARGVPKAPGRRTPRSWRLIVLPKEEREVAAARVAEDGMREDAEERFVPGGEAPADEGEGGLLV